MPRPKQGPRIYWRERGGRRRAYADFRELADVLDRDTEGSGRMPLIPEGDSVATDDPEIAHVLFTRKLEELRERKRTGVSTGRWRRVGLARFAAHHLQEKAKAGRVTEKWLGSTQHHLEEAVRFFGAERDVASIDTADVRRYLGHLEGLERGRRRNGGRLTAASLLHYLGHLSHLYRRAVAEGVVPPGYNPVSALMDRPQVDRAEAEWLEVHDAALYLEACRRYTPKVRKASPPAAAKGKRKGKPRLEMLAIPPAMLHAIVATFLLTGGRKSEVLGLTVGDVSFERGKVTFRKHAHRRLKTLTSARSVPLWPQLREVLVPYVASMPSPAPESLLFPSVRGTGMIRDLRKALDAVGTLAGWTEGEIRTKMFRHTYCAARLQTATRILKPGTEEVQWIPVSRDEVAREMGHGGTSLVARVYGHVGDVKLRGEVPEFRVENHQSELGKRLTALRVVA